MLVRENLITRLLSRHSLPPEFEILLIELNFRQKKVANLLLLSHDDYFYQNEFLQMYFSKIMQTFYDLLFTGNNSTGVLPKIEVISL